MNCKVCHLYHIEGGCFIQQYKPRPQKPYRIIVYDFESQQIPVDDDDANSAKKSHLVNFISAKIICTRCIEDGTWSQPLDQPCDICGDYRTRTWAPFDISDVHSERHKRTDNPLTLFTEWLLDGDKLDPAYKSICFAHFVNRFAHKFINL